VAGAGRHPTAFFPEDSCENTRHRSAQRLCGKNEIAAFESFEWMLEAKCRQHGYLDFCNACTKYPIAFRNPAKPH
jgi:hypothetical protein